MKLLIFLGGVMLGGIFGMLSLCLVQINRDSEEELRRFEEAHNEKK